MLGLLLIAWWWWPIIGWASVVVVSLLGVFLIDRFDKRQARVPVQGTPRQTGDLVDDLSAQLPGADEEKPEQRAHSA